MTVSSQIKEALSNLKSAQASLESFALQTQNQQAKQLLTSCSAGQEHHQYPGT